MFLSRAHSAQEARPRRALLTDGAISCLAFPTRPREARAGYAVWPRRANPRAGPREPGRAEPPRPAGRSWDSGSGSSDGQARFVRKWKMEKMEGTFTREKVS